MMTLPLTDCCPMLGIDAKTLRTWLRHANLELAPHPKDARLRCLTFEQVQQLALLHDRPLPSPATPCPAPMPEPPPPLPAQGLAHPTQASDALPSEADLLHKLSRLETHVTTLQEQVAQLALSLLQERETRDEHRLCALEALLPQAPAMPASGQERDAANMASQELAGGSSGKHLHPAELHARSRLIPLIEYGASGQYVVICPKRGELALMPDSAEWLEWFATLSSFRFVGQQGRFTAYRDSHRGRPSRSWRAHRMIRQRRYRHSLGTTDHLTIACLEQAAASLQAHLAAL